MIEGRGLLNKLLCPFWSVDVSEARDAFNLLGLPITASEDEVKEAYRKLSNKYHPDKEGGTHEKQTDLNRAYSIAMQISSSGTGIILIEAENSLEAINNSISIQNAQNAVSQFSNKKERETRARSATPRNIALGVSLISAVLALFGSNLLPILEDTNEEIYNTAKPMFGIVTFMAGFIALQIQHVASRSKQKIDQYLEYLSNKTHCASELARLLGHEDITQFDEHLIMKRSKRAPKAETVSLNTFFSSGLSTREEHRLIVLKALEHGLIFRIADQVITPNSIEKYRLDAAFKPSLFYERHNKSSKEDAVNRASS